MQMRNAEPANRSRSSRRLASARAKNRAWLERLVVLFLALALPLIVRTYVLTIGRVDGESMMPTFHSANRVAAWLWEYRLREPVRGEIVLCRYPDRDGVFVKRVIGLPTETIRVRGGEVFIDGWKLEEQYIANPASYDSGPVTLGIGEYFVMGDNRDNSLDSRADSVGPIPRKNLSGRAFAVVWPLNEWCLIEPSLYPLP
jgi:signal peptidase I